MTILALLSSGVFGAFVFSRRTMTASSARLLALSYAEQVAEELRTEIGAASLNAGVNQPRALPGGNPMVPLSPTRTYTIRNGKFDAAGNVVWEPGVDAQGNPINNTNYDFKEVRINVQWTQPSSS